MHHSESVVARLRRLASRTLTRAGTLALLGWLTCKPAFADLPSVEAPESGGGSGLSGQIKGYLQDGGMVGYQLLSTTWGGYYDLCTSVVDGELAPRSKGISEKAAEALRAEFADQEFRPLGEALSAVAKADGGSLTTADERAQRARTCLSEAG